MIPLFSRMPEIAAPVTFPSRWGYVRAGLQYNLERVQTFYRVFPQAVPSSHFLVRLLMSIGVNMSQPLASYFDKVDGRAKGLSMAMGMTSIYAKGQMHEGVFYGEGSSEVLLLDEDYFDFQAVHDRWRDASPIRVIQHPKSDFNLLLPLGKEYSAEHGLTVVSINVAMLAVMYRAFTLEQTRKRDSLSPYQFLGGYVIPNILASHLDLAVFNRFCRQAFGQSAELSRPVIRHSFRLPDYSAYIEQAAEQVVENAQRQRRNFIATLQGLPAVMKLDMAEALELPDIFPTQQIDWALHASRLKAMRLLLNLCADTAGSSDRTALARIMRSYAHNNIANMAEQMLPEPLAQEFFADMLAIEQKMLTA